MYKSFIVLLFLWINYFHTANTKSNISKLWFMISTHHKTLASPVSSTKTALVSLMHAQYRFIVMFFNSVEILYWDSEKQFLIKQNKTEAKQWCAMKRPKKKRVIDLCTRVIKFLMRASDLGIYVLSTHSVSRDERSMYINFNITVQGFPPYTLSFYSTQHNEILKMCIKMYWKSMWWLSAFLYRQGIGGSVTILLTTAKYKIIK